MMLADAHLHVAEHRAGGLGLVQRAVVRDEGGHLGQRDESRVPVRARHLLVDLGDDERARRRGEGGVDEVPSVQRPWRSGGESCTSATSSGMRPT
jgi:hypothetical protein